jgi:hypothetical protein
MAPKDAIVSEIITSNDKECKRKCVTAALYLILMCVEKYYFYLFNFANRLFVLYINKPATIQPRETDKIQSYQ